MISTLLVFCSSAFCIWPLLVSMRSPEKLLEPFLFGVPVLIVCVYYIFRFATSYLYPHADGSCTDFVYRPPHCQDMVDDMDGIVIEGLFWDIPCGSEIAGVANVNGYGLIFLLVVPAIIMVVICLTML